MIVSARVAINVRSSSESMEMFSTFSPFVRTMYSSRFRPETGQAKSAVIAKPASTVCGQKARLFLCRCKSQSKEYKCTAAYPVEDTTPPGRREPPFNLVRRHRVHQMDAHDKCTVREHEREELKCYGLESLMNCGKIDRKKKMALGLESCNVRASKKRLPMLGFNAPCSFAAIGGVRHILIPR